MFRKILLIFTAIAAAFFVSAAATSPRPDNELVLGKENTLVLRGEVTEESVNALIRELQLRPNQNLVLFLTSPGGSIMAGNHLVEAMRAYNGKITCYADIAISMAFVILQACPTRMVAPSSLLMQHEASYGLEGGEAPNNLSYVLFLTEMLKKMDTWQAKRLGMTYEDFKKKTANDWWMDGEGAIENKAADKVATAYCTKELTRMTYKQEVETFFAKATLVWSACPLLRAPLAIEKEVTDLSRASEADEFFKQVTERYVERPTSTTNIDELLRKRFKRIR